MVLCHHLTPPSTTTTTTTTTTPISSGGFQDELAWASSWLYAATKEPQYLELAKLKYPTCCKDTAGTAFGWDNKGKSTW